MESYVEDGHHIITPTMDAAYNAHQARRKSRSSTNLNHLSLAPLTTKLPINDTEMILSELSVQTSYTTSYIQGKSAPTTPSLLARSPIRARSPSRHGVLTPRGHGASSPNLPKSKSASHLSSRPKSGTTTPGGYRRGPKRENLEDPSSAAVPRGRTDSDWLLRAGVLISSETRESKGQSWLVSRASSTSLGRVEDGANDGENSDADMFQRERLARENAMVSKHASRRGSLAFVLDDESPFASRRGSVPASRTESRTQLVTPGERAAVDSYFTGQVLGQEEIVPGPDFVNLNEQLEAIGLETDTSQDDEATVRKLVKRGHSRPHTWFDNILGALFSVEENDDEDNEDADAEGTEGDAEDCLSEVSGGDKGFEGMPSLSAQRFSPPKVDDGGWQDAAWLLSLASKVAWS